MEENNITVLLAVAGRGERVRPLFSYKRAGKPGTTTGGGLVVDVVAGVDEFLSFFELDVVKLSRCLRLKLMVVRGMALEGDWHTWRSP